MGHLSENRITPPSRKAFLRFWAVLLSVVTVFSLLPAGITTDAAEAPTIRISADGVETNTVYMTTRERVELSALGAPEGARYQWQILHPESGTAWISIFDGIRQELSVTMALAKNMLRPDGTVQLRCKVTAGEEILYSDPVTVHITEPQPVQAARISQEPARQDTVSGAEGDEIPEFVTVTINYVRYDIKRDGDGKLVTDSEGNYVLEDAGQAFLPYIATLQGGSPISTTVANPTMVGYDAWFEGKEADSVTLDIPSVTTDVTYTVEYRPALVDYSVRYFLQNVYDDLYVEDTTIMAEETGYTGATPPDSLLRKEIPGFTSLYYQPDFIAADGSTVFEVYYERDYYLMEFDCNGGYGTETLYIRYGSYISVPQPIKSGWVFGGWDLLYTEESGSRVETENGTPDTLETTMPAYNLGYKAVWNTTDTTYTVVYWRENADDNGYSYWGSQQLNANSNTYVSGSDNVPNSVTTTIVDGENVNERPYFTYNDALTDKDVLVEGDGSTIVNVYYTRNTYTVYFRGISGTCVISEHSHGDGNCNTPLICGKVDHIHTDACQKALICSIPEHASHVDECLICGFAVHPSHSDECCSIAEHSHTSSCCTLTQHTHGTSCCSLEITSNYTTDCYANIGNHQNNSPEGAPRNPDEGEVYQRFNNSNKYIYIDGSWYRYNGTTRDEDIAPTVCDHHHSHDGNNCNSDDCEFGYEHTHGTDCIFGANGCPNYAHTHGDGECTCTIPLHTHIDSCYTDVIHTHTDECYSYSCNTDAHTHTDACYKACTLLEHTHSNRCNTNSTNNVIYVVTAKYEQTIGDVWPTASNFPNITFRGWTIDGISSTAVSKRVNMTADLCDTSDGLKYAEAVTGGSKTYLYYMFESFDQSSPANGNERILRNGIYYDKSDLYYQEVNSNSNWNQKEIAGMSPVAGGVVQSGSNIFLYYNRNRHTLSFHNVNQTIASIPEVLYQEPLKDLTLNETAVSGYIPPYPTTYEPGAYEFGGWYTTPQCFDGTEVDWADITMPNGDLTLYAKWTPILRNVTFYKYYDQIGTDATPFLKAEGVPHGELLGSTYNQQPVPDEGYRFVGWFYMDEDNKKRFAPDSMEITRDLVLFAEWTTSIDTTYQVEYVLKEDVSADATPSQTAYKAGDTIAAPDFNHITVGKTKTFQAKGGTQLDPDFREKFFPTTNSHSILMKENSADNTYRFEYVYDPLVYYKIRYVDYVTRTELRPSVTKPTEKAIVTEKFLPIEGYMPTSFYVTKALVSDGDSNGTTIPEENVLTFYYIQDTEHGMFSIEHYLENSDSTDSSNPDNYTLYESEVGSADVGDTKEADVRNYKGFAHFDALDTVVTYKNTGTSENPVYEEVVTTGSGKLSGEVTYMGLTIKIYYKRLEYPYVIEYREYGAAEGSEPLKKLKADGNPVGDPLPAQKYDSELTHIAEESFTLEGVTYEYYIPDSTEEERIKSTAIRVADESDPNKLIFYYTQKKIPVHYIPVCTEETTVEFGAVSIASESATSAARLGGCTPIPASGFVFDGWFHDKACTNPVDADWVDANNLLKPKQFTLDEGQNEDYYYARFSPVKRDLTIKKEGVTGTTDSFLFTVTGTNALGQEVSLTVSIQGSGEVTVKDLYCGEYTVTELTVWSWTYTANTASQTAELTVDKTEAQTVTFTNSYQTPDWLTGETSKENHFNQ